MDTIKTGRIANKFTLLAITISFVLNGCAQVTGPDGATSFQKKIEKPVLQTQSTSVPGMISEYANQLVGKGQAFATLRGFPFDDFVNGFRPRHPIVIYSINGIPLKAPAISIWGSLRNYHLSAALIKIPPGTYNSIVVTGVTSGAEQWFTEIKNATLKENVNYVLVPSNVNKEVQIAIRSYDMDKRFDSGEKEFHVLKEQTGTAGVLGNYKKVFNW